MPKFELYAGMGPGFGGTELVDTVICKDENEATMLAYWAARECYENYEGMHGLMSFQQCLDEVTEENPDLDEESIEAAAQEMYTEEVENWIDYHVKEIKE